MNHFFAALIAVAFALFAAPASAEEQNPIRVAGVVQKKTFTDTSFVIVTADTSYEVIGPQGGVGLVHVYQSNLRTTRLALTRRADGKYELFGIIRSFEQAHVYRISDDKRFITVAADEGFPFMVDITPWEARGYGLLNPDSIRVGDVEYLPNVLIVAEKRFENIQGLYGKEATEQFGYIATTPGPEAPARMGEAPTLGM